MPPAIATHELTKRFDTVTAVDALSPLTPDDAPLKAADFAGSDVGVGPGAK